MDINKLVAEIKKKKELSGLDDEVILESINKAIKGNGNSISISKDLSPKEEKLLIKLARANLRKLSGRFKTSFSERLALLNSNNITGLLETHSSTKERLPFYEEVKKIIFSTHPSTILDLGCGINPIAIADPQVKYFASDIQKEDLELVKSYFEKNRIKGETFVFDLRKSDQLDNLPSADLCLMFKLVDILESNGHKLAEKIIVSLKCKNILVSFSTKTLSGKPMNHPQRGWIERMLNRLSYNFEIFKIKNEIFYLIKKQT